MALFVSHPDPDGHVVLVDLPSGSLVAAVFASEEGRRVELTGQLADFVLLGMRCNARLQQGIDGTPAEDDQIEVAAIELRGAPPTFVYAHPASQEVSAFGWDVAAHMLGLAVSHLVTDGVASEAADAPDDASGLEAQADGEG
jgi:hypothetical protein